MTWTTCVKYRIISKVYIKIQTLSYWILKKKQLREINLPFICKYSFKIKR